MIHVTVLSSCSSGVNFVGFRIELWTLYRKNPSKIRNIFHLLFFTFFYFLSKRIRLLHEFFLSIQIGENNETKNSGSFKESIFQESIFRQKHFSTKLFSSNIIEICAPDSLADIFEARTSIWHLLIILTNNYLQIFIVKKNAPNIFVIYKNKAEW
jgi:hypothetical protein